MDRILVKNWQRYARIRWQPAYVDRRERRNVREVEPVRDRAAVQRQLQALPHPSVNHIRKEIRDWKAENFVRRVRRSKTTKGIRPWYARIGSVDQPGE
jgi:hypothetical protein